MPSFISTPVHPILTPQEFFLLGVGGPGPVQNPPPPTSTVGGTSSVTANLTATGTLASSIAGTSIVAASLAAKGALASAIVGSSSLSASLEMSNALNAQIEGFANVVGFLDGPRPPKPGQNAPYVLRDFGATFAHPAYLSTSGNGLNLFYQTSFIPNVNAGTVTPPQWSTPGTPDNFGYQGRVQSPGQLLVAPGNGSLSGKIYKIMAEGMIFVPASAVNASFNLQMFQNYFTFQQAEISDALFSLTTPIPLEAGSIIGFELIATLAGNGVGNGVVSSAGRLNVDGVAYHGSGFSNRLKGREPILQLSLGVQFNGSVSSGDMFQAFLGKFQMFNVWF